MYVFILQTKSQFLPYETELIYVLVQFGIYFVFTAMLLGTYVIPPNYMYICPLLKPKFMLVRVTMSRLIPGRNLI